MSVDFTWLDKQSGIDKVSLSESDFEILAPALSVLKAKTGLQIDPYSDTRVGPSHASLLLEQIKSNHLDKGIQLYKLVEMLMNSVKKSRWILVIGD